MIDNYLSCDITNRIDMYLQYPEKLRDIFINDEESINELKQILYNYISSCIADVTNEHVINGIRDDMDKIGIELKYYNGFHMLLINIEDKRLWDIDKLLDRNKNLTRSDVEQIYHNKLEDSFNKMHNYFRHKYNIKLYKVGKDNGYIGFKSDLGTYEVNRELLENYIHNFIIDAQKIKKIMGKYSDNGIIDSVEYISDIITDHLESDISNGIVDNKLIMISSKVKTLFNELYNKINETIEELDKLYNELLNYQ